MNDAAPNAWLPLPLRKLAGRALGHALNRAVSLDPDTAQRLRSLDGHQLQLHLHGPEIALAITVEQGRLHVGPPAADSTLRVSATPGSLLAMALRRGDGAMAPGKVAIAGDAELARRLEKLANQFAPDFEEAFARLFGDVLGVPLAKTVRQALLQLRESTHHLVEDGVDWLRDEARLTPAHDEVDDFLDAVDRLREHSDRLEARLTRFERQQDTLTTPPGTTR